MAQTLLPRTLRAQASQLRTAKYDGRTHIVVPVILLVEGVVRSASGNGPELVPEALICAAPSGWNGRPCVGGHPQDAEGEYISANDPRVLEREQFGQLFHSSTANGKLQTEAYLDPSRVKPGSIAAETLTRLARGEMVEISVGVLVAVEWTSGTYAPTGQTYQGVWVEMIPDHLAFLSSKERGACSNDMGCGAPRVATAAKELKDMAKVVTLTTRCAKHATDTPTDEICPRCLAESLTAGKETTKAQRLRAAVTRMLTKLGEIRVGADTPAEAAAEEAAELIKYKAIGTLLDGMETAFATARGLVNDLIADETETPAESAEEEAAETEVEGARLEALNATCIQMYAALNGIMSIAWDLWYDTEYKDDNATPRYATGKRNSTRDQKTLQEMHDMSTKLGALCTETKALSAPTPCGCGSAGEGERQMAEKTKAERIAALLSHPKFKDTFDPTQVTKEWLEKNADVTIAALESSLTPPATAAITTTTESKPADAAKMTREQFLSENPEIQDIITRQKKADTDRRVLLVKGLTASQKEYTEAELTAMPLDQLERLHRVAKSTTADYSLLMGGSVDDDNEEEGISETHRNPPKPYALALKQREQKIQ